MVKILVVDDERDIRNLLIDILVDAGYDVIEAKDGATALDQAVQEKPDLILLDVRMPEMDGFEVLDILKTFPNTESIPVVILTALRAVKGELQAWRMGVKHYITKPFSSNRVELAVKVALREAEDYAEKEEEAVRSVAWKGSGSKRHTSNVEETSGLISTGSRELNQILGGGIPLGSLTLMEGNAETGKSVLVQHIAYEALSDDHRVNYFVSDNTASGIVAQMGSIGLGVTKYSRSGKLNVAPLEDQNSIDDDCEMSTSPDMLLDLAAKEIGSIHAKYKVVILDHVTDLFMFSQERTILRFFASCKRICAEGRVIIVVAQSHAFDKDMLERVSGLCDAHFSLIKEKMGTKLGTSLEVVKSDGMELNRDNTLSFEILSGTGIKMLAFGKVRV